MRTPITGEKPPTIGSNRFQLYGYNTDDSNNLVWSGSAGPLNASIIVGLLSFSCLILRLLCNLSKDTTPSHTRFALNAEKFVFSSVDRLFHVIMLQLLMLLILGFEAD